MGACAKPAGNPKQAPKARQHNMYCVTAMPLTCSGVMSSSASASSDAATSCGFTTGVGSTREKHAPGTGRGLLSKLLSSGKFLSCALSKFSVSNVRIDVLCIVPVLGAAMLIPTPLSPLRVDSCPKL